jgi:Zn-dependent peptidase ImmA (M78 family)
MCHWIKELWRELRIFSRHPLVSQYFFHGCFNILHTNLPQERIEVEANQFAERILMPAHLVRQAYDDGMTGLDNLAAKFDVSLHAMAITLAKLYR